MTTRKLCLVGLLLLTFLSGCGPAPRQGPVSTAPPALTQPTPPKAETLWRQAEQEQKAGNVQAALNLWERIAQEYADNAVAARAYYKMGTVYLEQNQIDRAIQFFDYLLFTYPTWDGANLARLDRLRAFWMAGRKKQVMKESTALWDALAAQPDLQVRLGLFMASVYQSEGDRETAFEWLTAGMSSAQSQGDQKAITQATQNLLKDTSESGIRKLSKKKLPDVMMVFLDFRAAQLDLEKGESDAAHERLNTLLSQHPTHPLAPEIQAALRGAPVAARKVVPTEVVSEALPVNANRVGCLLPLNGSYEKYGHLVLRGLLWAVEDWNQKHSDQTVTMLVKDTQADPEQAAKSMEDLVKQDGVLAIIGPLGTQFTKAVSPLAAKWNVPVLTLTQKDEEIPDSSFVIHVFLDNRALVHHLVRYCREKLGYTRFATLYPDDRYGNRLSKIFTEAVQQQGGKLLANVPYKEKSTDFREPIQNLLNQAKQNSGSTGVESTVFEALFIPDQVQTLSLIAPQLPYNNVVGATLLGTNLWAEGSLVQAGGVHVEQALFATPFFAESPAPRVRAFRERYQKTYNATPSYLEAQAYDALMLFLQGRSASPAASMGRSTFLQNLLKIRAYQGVAGLYSFTPQGDLERNYLLIQVQNGQLVQISP